MTREEAIKLLDPKTTREALVEIEYYGGFNGDAACVAAIEDACMLAVEALKRQMPTDFITGVRALASLVFHEIDRLDEDFREKGKNYYESDYYYGIARGFNESRMAVERLLPELEKAKGDSNDTQKKD